MNFIQPIGFDGEPTASIDADLSVARAIEKDLADFLARAKARIADLECAETKRLLSDLDDCVAVVRSDCLSGAADELERALSERDDDGRASYWRGLNQAKPRKLDNTVANRERGGVAVTELQAFLIDNDTDGRITHAVVDRVLAQYPAEGRS